MSAPPAQGKSVLILEEDHEFRKLVEQVLRKQGHVVAGKSMGAEARAELAEHGFDVLILSLPDSGHLDSSLVQGLTQRRWSSTPALIVTAPFELPPNTEEGLRSAARSLTILRKPFTLAEFLRAVSSAAAERPSADNENTASAGDESASDTEQAQRALSAHFPSPQDFLREYNENIRSGGLYLAEATGCEIGQQVELRVQIDLPERPPRTFLFDAEVAYVRRDEDGQPSGLGVQIQRGKQDGAKALAAVARQLVIDLRKGQPALLLVYGFESELDLLRSELPDAQIRAYGGDALPDLPREAAAELPDAILISATPPLNPSASIRELRANKDLERTTVLTAAEEGFRGDALASGADAFFSYPDGPRQLVQQVAELLAQSLDRHVRVPFRAPIELHLGPVIVHLQGVNLSIGGVAAAGQIQLPLGHEVRLVLRLPDAEVPIECSSRVVWVQRIVTAPQVQGPTEETWLLGLAFDGLSDRLRARLATYVFFARQAEQDPDMQRLAASFERAQRRAVRVPFHDAVSLLLKGATISASGIDISVGGIAVHAPAGVPEEEELDVAFQLPDNEQDIRCKTEVCWTQKNRDNDSYRIGLRFIDLRPADRKQIREYVSDA